jgi:hypothetical protein
VRGISFCGAVCSSIDIRWVDEEEGVAAAEFVFEPRPPFSNICCWGLFGVCGVWGLLPDLCDRTFLKLLLRDGV